MSSDGILMPTDLTVRRLNYSAHPWRIVHQPTDREVWWEKAPTPDGIDGAPPELPVCGYSTKAAATDALLRYLDQQITTLAKRTPTAPPSDGIRERQLADLGWRDATVHNDGRTVTVTMSVRDFDRIAKRVANDIDKRVQDAIAEAIATLEAVA